MIHKILHWLSLEKQGTVNFLDWVQSPTPPYFGITTWENWQAVQPQLSEELLLTVDGKVIQDEPSLMEEFDKHILWRWWGRNYDALCDCLRNIDALMEIPGEFAIFPPGLLVLIHHAEKLFEENDSAFATTLDIFQAAGEYWNESTTGWWDSHAPIPFHVLLLCPQNFQKRLQQRIQSLLPILESVIVKSE